jgi:hypothetical protein
MASAGKLQMPVLEDKQLNFCSPARFVLVGLSDVIHPCVPLLPCR